MNVVVLGVTGSIGSQTLDVCERMGVEPVALAANSGTGEFPAAAERYPDAQLAVAAPDDPDELKRRFGSRIEFGAEAVTALAATPHATVVNAIVGFAGLDATLETLRNGNRLALANKESMVAAGPIVNAVRNTTGAELIPVDSEHSALFQCLEGEDAATVRRLLLTASGGPFRGATADELAEVTPERALNHPTWTMGPRITIDSATLVNKGLEVIEAHHLFDVPFDAIDVVVHPQSIVHSLVEFVDGSLKAHVGVPDMRIPIQYALTYPGRADLLPPFALAGHTLVFEEPDTATFPALSLAYAAGRTGGAAPAVYNAADEVAVEAFLDGRIGFTDIPVVLERTLELLAHAPGDTVEAIKEADVEARRIAGDLVTRGWHQT